MWPAAFVGDIYTQNIVQGPSIPTAMRSMLTQIYSRNVPLWNSRMKAALDIVRFCNKQCSFQSALRDL